MLGSALALFVCVSVKIKKNINKRKKLKVSKDDTGGTEREHFPQSTFYLETFRPTLKHNKNCRVCAFFVDL